jgi:hypothetical protein
VDAASSSKVEFLVDRRTSECGMRRDGRALGGLTARCANERIHFVPLTQQLEFLGFRKRVEHAPQALLGDARSRFGKGFLGMIGGGCLRIRQATGACFVGSYFAGRHGILSVKAGV